MLDAFNALPNKDLVGGRMSTVHIAVCACPNVKSPVECYAIRYDKTMQEAHDSGDECDCYCHESDDDDDSETLE